MKNMHSSRQSASQDARLTLQQLGFMTLLSGFVALTLPASEPAWWTATGGPLNTHAANDYQAANQGQTKQFTEKGINYLNANLTNGAGSTLNGLVTGWSNYYATNGYSATNHPPVDYRAMNDGQLKYIGRLFYTQLATAGYMSTNYPSWTQTNASDYTVASLGELKQVFAFEAAVPQTPSNLTVVLSGTNATLSWFEPVISVQTFTLQESANGGAWTNIATVSGNYAPQTLTGLSLGTNYSFRVVAANGAGSSAASSSNAAPIITLANPSGATLIP